MEKDIAGKLAKAPRGRPRTFNQQDALARALRVFWENGYEQTTMKQLTKVMGIASPSIYCAFGNKCDLFLEALKYYRSSYWEPEFKKFMLEKDLCVALENLFSAAVDILLSPDAPCGCLTIFTAVSLPAKEMRIKEAVQKMRCNTRKYFTNKLEEALQTGSLLPETDCRALAGALTNFFEGLALQATQIKSHEELLDIALTGIALIKPFYISKIA